MDFIYIVSGLPRSGTSMVMKMLELGGIEILADNHRTPDMDNPKGYFEYAPVKNLAQDSSWVHSAENKGIKVISHLLRFLPSEKKYKILFMLRPLQEILISQKLMLQRNNTPFSENLQTSLAHKLQDHLFKIRLWIVSQSHFECLFLHYHSIISNPQLWAKRISIFLEQSCNPHIMAEAVDRSLYRNKG